MNLIPPPGSRIRFVDEDSAEPILVVPAARSADGIVLTCVIMGFVWLRLTMASPDEPVFWSPLSIVLLAGRGLWVFCALYFVYRAVRPARDRLRLKREGVVLDTAFQPPEILPGTKIRGLWPGYRGARIDCEIDLEQLKSLRLRASFDSRRLTVDVDGWRIEIGRGVSEAEREWLAGFLADRYGLAHECVGCG